MKLSSNPKDWNWDLSRKYGAHYYVTGTHGTGDGRVEFEIGPNEADNFASCQDVPREVVVYAKNLLREVK